MKLTKEEKGLLESVEKGEWKFNHKPAELKKFREAAARTLALRKKDARLNIRISSEDLNGLRKRALEEGLPYQTFVSSLLHKFVTGRLVEAK